MFSKLTCRTSLPKTKSNFDNLEFKLDVHCVAFNNSTTYEESEPRRFISADNKVRFNLMI